MIMKEVQEDLFKQLFFDLLEIISDSLFLNALELIVNEVSAERSHMSFDFQITRQSDCLTIIEGIFSKRESCEIRKIELQ